MQIARDFFEISRPILQQSASNISSFCSPIFRLFYEQTIFFALSNQAIEASQLRYQGYSLSQKVGLGLIHGVVGLYLGIVVIKIIDFVFKKMKIKEGKPATSKTTLYETIQGAIIEEILFRYILQNLIRMVQVTLFPKCLTNYVIVQWMVSTSARILITNTLFAIVHLSNGGVLQSDKGALIQTLKITLLPRCCILYETANTLFAPIASHVINNSCYRIMCAAEKKVRGLKSVASFCF